MKFAILTLIIAAAALGCARNVSLPPTRLSFQRFVSVMAELGSAQPHQRAAILGKHGTNDAEIREFVQVYSRDPRQLSAAFDSIEHVLEKRHAPSP